MRRLKNTKTGVIYMYTRELASLPHMELVKEDPKPAEAPAQPKPKAAPKSK
jgi:hypothetical protein